MPPLETLRKIYILKGILHSVQKWLQFIDFSLCTLKNQGKNAVTIDATLKIASQNLYFKWIFAFRSRVVAIYWL